MPITKEKAIEACYDGTAVHDENEQGKLLWFLKPMTDPQVQHATDILRANSSNKTIVAFLREEMAAAAAAQPPAAPPAGRAHVSEVGDWTRVFKDAGINPTEHVLGLVVKHFSTRIPYIRNSKDAVELYNDAARLPASSTKKLLYQQESIKLNGLFSGGMPSRAVLLYGFRGTAPLIVKIPTSMASAAAEADVAKALQVAKAFDAANQVASHLVGPIQLIHFDAGSTIEVADEHRHARAALVMPVYASTLEHIPTPMDEADVARVATQMVVAVDFMHMAGYAHCDIKAPNIFLDVRGDAFLGDYGAAVKVGSELKEVTRTHIPLDKDFTTGTEELDSWLLAVTLLEKLGLIKFGVESKWKAEDVMIAAASVSNAQLKELFAKLLRL